MSRAFAADEKATGSPGDECVARKSAPGNERDANVAILRAHFERLTGCERIQRAGDIFQRAVAAVLVPQIEERIRAKHCPAPPPRLGCAPALLLWAGARCLDGTLRLRGPTSLNALDLTHLATYPRLNTMAAATTSAVLMYENELAA